MEWIPPFPIFFIFRYFVDTALFSVHRSTASHPSFPCGPSIMPNPTGLKGFSISFTGFIMAISFPRIVMTTSLPFLTLLRIADVRFRSSAAIIVFIMVSFYFFPGIASFAALIMLDFTTFLTEILIASSVAGLQRMQALRSTWTSLPGLRFKYNDSSSLSRFPMPDSN